MRQDNVDKVKITERGWIGHFIGGHDCRFRRNTLIEYGKKGIVVSTVGDMVIDNNTIQIGVNRYYETMAFGAIKGSVYWDASTKQIDFNSRWAISGKSLKDLPDDVDNIANGMHEAVVAELAEKIKEMKI